MDNDILLKADHVYKTFGVTKALVDVGITLKRGQVLGLVGENGSGKSTLATILSAIQAADSGNMMLDDMPYAPQNSVEASALGVCMIMQESGTFGNLTVAENIFAGKEALFSHYGFLNIHEMNQRARSALDMIGAHHISEVLPASQLDFEERKLVELARACWSDPKVLIIDETTTALSQNGREILYEIMNQMKRNGRSIIFISHDIEELMDKCDRLVVLRDGKYITELSCEEYEAHRIKCMMVGREVTENYYRTDKESCRNTQTVLKVKNVSTDTIKEMSFDLHKGEILGIGGLADSGMHEVGRIVYGLTLPDAGMVCVDGGMQIHGPRSAMNLGVGYMSKNRDIESLMIASSISDNICLPSYKKIQKMGVITARREKKFVTPLISEMEIKMRDLNQFALELSGGNKQKVVIAKWLGFGADILVLDCPTRGIDIGVKATIYHLMNVLRSRGVSMILVSEELSEIIGMSDRILIMKEGKINGEFLREEELNERKLIEYMV